MEGGICFCCGHFHLTEGLSEKETCCVGDRQKSRHTIACQRNCAEWEEKWKSWSPGDKRKGRAPAGLTGYPTG